MQCLLSTCIRGCPWDYTTAVFWSLDRSRSIRVDEAQEARFKMRRKRENETHCMQHLHEKFQSADQPILRKNYIECTAWNSQDVAINPAFGNQAVRRSRTAAVMSTNYSTLRKDRHSFQVVNQWKRWNEERKKPGQTSLMSPIPAYFIIPFADLFYTKFFLSSLGKCWILMLFVF